MRASTMIMILASIGFILMGLIVLKSKKIKSLLDKSCVYTDTEKFLKTTGSFNIAIGGIGFILGGLDYMFIEYSKYIVLFFITTITILAFMQSRMGKKYRNC